MCWLWIVRSETSSLTYFDCSLPCESDCSSAVVEQIPFIRVLHCAFRPYNATSGPSRLCCVCRWRFTHLWLFFPSADNKINDISAFSTDEDTFPALIELRLQSTVITVADACMNVAHSSNDSMCSILCLCTWMTSTSGIRCIHVISLSCAR